MFGIILLGLVLIFSVIVIIMGLLVIIYPQKYGNKKDLQIGKSNRSRRTLIHLSGHPYMQANEEISFQICTNQTIKFFKGDNFLLGKEIPISNLTRYEVKTETEIKKDVTLARLIALGIFAFGVKKETKIEDQYLILSYIQNGVEIDCVFKRKDPEEQLGNIASEINRVKLEAKAG